jgi:hypothetical protein
MSSDTLRQGNRFRRIDSGRFASKKRRPEGPVAFGGSASAHSVSGETAGGAMSPRAHRLQPQSSHWLQAPRQRRRAEPALEYALGLLQQLPTSAMAAFCWLCRHLPPLRAPGISLRGFRCALAYAGSPRNFSLGPVGNFRISAVVYIWTNIASYRLARRRESRFILRVTRSEIRPCQSLPLDDPPLVRLGAARAGAHTAHGSICFSSRHAGDVISRKKRSMSATEGPGATGLANTRIASEVLLTVSK